MSTEDVVSCADDTVIFYRGNTWKKLRSKVENITHQIKYLVIDIGNHLHIHATKFTQKLRSLIPKIKIYRSLCDY